MISTPLTPPPVRLSVDRIAQSLREAIWAGKLKSGQPLRQDEIAAQFNVSKIPVREALAQLKSEGLVMFYPNRGAIVSELTPAEVDELYTMRIALECAALERAIPMLTIADLGHAEKILTALDNEQNVVHWSELNWQFHATLYRSSGMPRLMETVKTLHFNISRYLILYLDEMDYQATSQAEHRTILEACRQGDIPAATISLKQHLLSANEHLVVFLKNRTPK